VNRKADFFTKRIDSHNESNRIDSNRELECSTRETVGVTEPMRFTLSPPLKLGHRVSTKLIRFMKIYKGITFSKRDVYRSLDRSADTLTTSVLSPGDLLSVYARRVSSFLTAHQHIIGHFSAMTGQIDIRTDTRTRFQLNLPFLQILPTTALPFSSSMTM